jgi:hypothetical protein
MKLVKQILVAASGLAVLAVGFYAVNGAPASAAATPSVQVVNAPSDPVPVAGVVRVRNNPGNPLTADIGNPVGAQCDANFDADGQAGCQIASVPEGQILVIEEITCGVSVKHLAPAWNLLLTMGSPKVPPDTGLLNLNHRLGLTKGISVLGGSPELDYYGLTDQVRMYAVGGPAGGGGSTAVWVYAQVGESTASTGQLACAISGHMLAQ